MVNEQGTRKRYPPLDPATGGPPAGECAEGDIGRTALAPYTTDYLRDQAVEFLEHGESDEATDSKPWFLYVAPFAPHRPHTAEADYANLNFSPYTWNPATFEDTSDKPPGGDTTTPAEISAVGVTRGAGSDSSGRCGRSTTWSGRCSTS
jgi:arylsulfatase A-like enzyme